MMSRRRVSGFPWRRLPRLAAQCLKLRLAPSAQLLGLWQKAADTLAEKWRLGRVGIEFCRMDTLAIERLREELPGQWRFALLLEPLAGRHGYVAADPLLCSRLAAAIDPGRVELRGWCGEIDGCNGLLGLAAASLLDALCALDSGFEPWRYGGLVGSVGEIGRGSLACQAFSLIWLRIRSERGDGFLAWLEPEQPGARHGSTAGAARLGAAAMSVPLECRLEWGTVELPADQAASLRHGDILLLDPHSQPLLRLGELGLLLEEGENGFIVGKWEESRGGTDMSEMQLVPQRAGGLEAQRISQLPVELKVEAGRIRLKLEQVLALKAGDVLAVAEKVLGAVDVLAGEKLLARGELVDVEGRRGVRLLEVLLLGEERHEGLA